MTKQFSREVIRVEEECFKQLEQKALRQNYAWDVPVWLEVDLGFILRYGHLYTLVGKKPEQLNNFPNSFYNSYFSWVIFYASGIS